MRHTLRTLAAVVGLLLAFGVVSDVGAAGTSSYASCSGVTDAYARQFVIDHVQDGPSIAAHMITRSCVDETLTDPRTGLPEYDATGYYWGGYVDTVTYSGSVVTKVESYNTYERASDSYPIMSSWVGIGGVKSTNLAQDGANNNAPAVTWYELYPAPAHTTGVYPRAGDQMLYLVQFDYSNGKYYFLEEDTTTNHYASQEYAFTPDINTAEWITEQFAGGPAAACNPITFGTASWSDQYGQWWILNSHASTDAYYALPWNGGEIAPSSISGSNTFTNSITP